ncbi:MULTISPECIES: rhodanese-like domain-containing protein [unclassified Guyparkeria]|uniref:rhodanese-like domain-containing protein n=1 Tax=unclassified Guyparkeria TaxID=2626246 RepID=UPI00073342F2|nr:MULTISPECIES: rhodanese-like domain-containing protein [unclassified Guyparkeria]KTG16642.1 sulfurtransferase [Guyparkeria sp. XI15]OAE85676.1 sulfurtransferase [Guyparkeria sp. WRN-7]
MTNLKTLLTAPILALAFTGGPAMAENEELVDAMQGYAMFQEYHGATIRPEQIPAGEWENITIVDTRDAGQYAEDHIPGAINIEWRQILERRDELPTDEQVLVYCNTGTLSAQAGLMLRLAGMDNVRILQGGFTGFKEAGGFEANARAQEAVQEAAK